VIENPGNSFEHYELTSLDFGPSASGEFGWLMSSGFSFRCHACGYLMQGGTTDESCTCGALQRESIGRFRSRFGDDAIEVFEAPKGDRPTYMIARSNPGTIGLADQRRVGEMSAPASTSLSLYSIHSSPPLRHQAVTGGAFSSRPSTRRPTQRSDDFEEKPR
jgi:hypothetical protein